MARSASGANSHQAGLGELLKQIGWQPEPMRIAHFRPVIERDDGSVVGIEVKAAASVGTGDFKGLRQLAAACGPALRIGLVLYDGNAAVRFGERLWAVPVACVLG